MIILNSILIKSFFIPAIVGSILGITIEYLVNGDFMIENIWTFLFLNLGFLYQAYRKQKRTKEKKNSVQKNKPLNILTTHL